MSGAAERWPSRRFSQAISEGDGISVIPVLRGDLAAQARNAEEAGAEALAVDSIDELRRLRPETVLPVLVRSLPLDAASLLEAREAGADACMLPFEELEDSPDLLVQLAAEAAGLGLDCAIDVRDEEELDRALELLDPEILVLSERDPEKDELELERTLDLLPDVPAGKLVVSESRVTSREQVLALERAGVDAVLLARDSGGEGVLAELTGRPAPGEGW